MKYYDKPFNDTMFFIYDYLIKEQTISYSNEFNMTIQNLIKKKLLKSLFIEVIQTPNNSIQLTNENIFLYDGKFNETLPLILDFLNIDLFLKLYNEKNLKEQSKCYKYFNLSFYVFCSILFTILKMSPILYIIPIEVLLFSTILINCISFLLMLYHYNTVLFSASFKVIKNIYNIKSFDNTVGSLVLDDTFELITQLLITYVLGVMTMYNAINGGRLNKLLNKLFTYSSIFNRNSLANEL